MLERPGELVTREELQQRIWPADTFVDFDHSLNTSINKLREALNDSAGAPRYIETLPRRGYRLLIAVQSAGEKVAAAVSSNGGSTSSQRGGPDPLPLVNQLQPVIGLQRESGATDGSTKLKVSADTLDSGGVISRGWARFLFNLIQAMYFFFYVLAVGHLPAVHDIAERFSPQWATTLVVLVTLTGIVGIAVRLFLFSVVSFDVQQFGQMFRKLFPALMPFDAVWALSPFLISHRIGAGFALVAVTALLWVPFAQRTLVRMISGDGGTRQL